MCNCFRLVFDIIMLSVRHVSSLGPHNKYIHVHVLVSTHSRRISHPSQSIEPSFFFILWTALNLTPINLSSVLVYISFRRREIASNSSKYVSIWAMCFILVIVCLKTFSTTCLSSFLWGNAGTTRNSSCTRSRSEFSSGDIHKLTTLFDNRIFFNQ